MTKSQRTAFGNGIMWVDKMVPHQKNYIDLLSKVG